ncbi:hypothetical protein GUITHDRAFT_102308 [Guillardia theta CCMP2712]|uniref:RRM domain-containing protein n=1 Tax=Guillardia theta (strain CCMP2712) TaxID=905079 RepID=L1JTE2_GUITC|nr:hypothetical protein GUITHDRAFT_102308 [Guillardia theta CCMP2712]EKX51702.1 hypothetical protein GUITHDRAFT_102308 [Guillardia theta CCMP2712]|eukprot:XP_005838682.1 hypothetical protein GUITHDRAFT_102308 [Guillardia theta CCMP2712]
MNAYVVFLDENCARSAAKACNGINLTITYNRTGGEQQKILQKSSCVIRCDIATGANYVSARSIFLGNVPFVNASEDSIRNIWHIVTISFDESCRLLFRSCGDIENVRLVRDKMTGYGKGFGYIQFVNETSVHKALQMAKHRPPSLCVGERRYELRIQAAMKPMHLERKKKVKQFLEKGGKKAYQKRMKRWKARKKKRFEVKTGVRKKSKDGKDSPRSEKRAYKQREKLKSDSKSTKVQVVTKGQHTAKKKKESKSRMARKGEKKVKNKKVGRKGQ